MPVTALACQLVAVSQPVELRMFLDSPGSIKNLLIFDKGERMASGSDGMGRVGWAEWGLGSDGGLR